MTTTSRQKEMEIHESEWVYSTALSRMLHDANRYIHGIESLAHPIEFAVFLCGYAFNPVMIPVWAGLVFCYASSSALFATLFYLSTVLVTLLATETCKALFSATRPEQILGDDAYRASRLRRYGTRVSSLKSKHSFPSGDCAQAANLCFFVLYNPGENDWWVTWTAFGVFLPGVCFARVFYHCHWIEDCMGGIALSAILHWLVMPHVGAVLSGLEVDTWK